uniref:Agroclavine dehydrogenase n=1 Tax=Claviceps paspali TaxID=40601 RepID=G8GV76_CLAPA|nr:agroclavine dehydrogenase [Claviceps paspali]
MTILLTGGNGKTTRQIARLFEEAKLPFVTASRSPSHPAAKVHRKFDWLDEATFANALSSDDGMKPVSAIWLVAPPVADPAPPVIKFIDLAREKGVKRFVLLSASIIEKGGPAMGSIHAHLDSLAGISYAVLRPTWFMENFSTAGEFQFETMAKENNIYSAAEDGKIPFISTVDIARVAFRALTADSIDAKDLVLVGPELLTYDDVAKTLSKVLGRDITHVRVTEAALAEKRRESGVPADIADMIASMDLIVRSGAEDRMNTAVKDFTGVEPRSFAEFASKEREAWLST